MPKFALELARIVWLRIKCAIDCCFGTIGAILLFKGCLMLKSPYKVNWYNTGPNLGGMDVDLPQRYAYKTLQRRIPKNQSFILGLTKVGHQGGIVKCTRKHA